MFGSTVLEVVIGLVFLYLSLSLICSALNEYYSALVSRRAAHLRDSLYALFNKDDPKGLAFLVEFYTHPLISGLSPSRKAVQTTPTPAPASVRYRAGGYPAIQAAVIVTARLWADGVRALAGLSARAMDILRWIVEAFRDPYGSGRFFTGMRKELSTAAKATPAYIPDRAFSGALFAVLASDSDASRRLQVELRVQLAGIDKMVMALADPAASKGLAKGLLEVNKSLEATVGVAKSPEEIMDAAKVEFAKLLALIPANPPGQPASEVRAKIEKALETVLAAGPKIPSTEQVRDHVWQTLEASLNRLKAGFASLPAGPLRDALIAKVDQASTAMTAAKQEPTMTLEQARDAARRTFAEIRGAIDGANDRVDWSKAAGWVEREIAALAASETDLITIAKLRDAVAALPESDIRAALLSLMDEVGDDLDKVKRNIQVWYNDSMERVSGWYKRNTQVLLTLIAVAIAGTMNADTIAVAKQLWSDSTLRANVNAVARSVNPAELTAKSAPGAKSKDQESAAAELDRSALKILKESNLPLGWSKENLKDLGFGDQTMPALRAWTLPPWDRTKVWFLLEKLLGLALTAIAISMGAPFWFDMLNKLVNVRTVGLQPQKTPDKPPVETLKS